MLEHEAGGSQQVEIRHLEYPTQLGEVAINALQQLPYSLDIFLNESIAYRGGEPIEEL